MAERTVNGDEKLARSGARTLLLLAAPLNGVILNSLADGPRQLVDLQLEAGLPAQTTLRAQLERLINTGAVGKRRRNRFPGVLEYELTDGGRELLFVVRALERWLDRSDAGHLVLGEGTATAAVKALVEGWSTAMLRALAGSRLSLTDLDRLIGSLSYPSLERRLAAMRLAGLVAAEPAEGRTTPYSITDWAREGIAPLLAASRWEQAYADHPACITRVDVETAFLLALPLLRVPDGESGSCRLTVDLGEADRHAGVVLSVQGGRVAACTTRIEGQTDAWATGGVAQWLEALNGDGASALAVGGRTGLTDSLLAGLRRAYSSFTAKSS